ncbi:MAG: hypothetical protein F082_1247 [bacterium F082]|nr:MAG: hypothetical protein F082_1247 [bacterium F082]KWW28933.1 MAG: hypothetical protein AUK64_1399 [bacterium P201]
MRTESGEGIIRQGPNPRISSYLDNPSEHRRDDDNCKYYYKGMWNFAFFHLSS